MGERSRVPKLRIRHQSRGVGPESNHHRNRNLSELRLVRADRHTNYRPSATEEADFSSVIVLRRNWELQLVVLLLVRHFAHVCTDEFAGNLRIIVRTADQACLYF